MSLFSKNNNDDEKALLPDYMLMEPAPVSNTITSSEETEKIEMRPSVPENKEPQVSDDDDNITETATEENETTNKAPETESLLFRCMPFTTDENGKNMADDIPPAYNLESVEDIISSFEKKADEKINGLYSEKPKSETVAAEKNLIDELTVRLNSVREESPKTFSATPIKEEKEENVIKTYQSSIDDTKIIHGKVIGKSNESAIEATRQFTKLSDESLKTESFVKEPTGNTQVLNDVPRAEKKFAPLTYDESDDYDDIIEDVNGYKSFADAKEFGFMYIKAKRNAVLRFIITTVLTLIITLIKFPLFDGFRVSSPDAYALISLALLIVTVTVNARIFKGITCLFNSMLSSELPYAVITLFTLIHSIINLISGNVANVPNFNAAAAVAIEFSALGELIRSAYTLNNFKRIANKRVKSAFKFIKGEAANTVANTAIEGDALIGIGKRCTNVLGFVNASKNFDGAAYVISVTTGITFVLSVLISILSGVFLKSSTAVLNTLTTLICLSMPVMSVIISVLPLKKVSDSLERYQAQISGYECAGKIEQVNAVVLDSDMLFPKGSVELVNIKVLGNASIDSILVDCAALAGEIGSPLFPIFDDIASSRKSADLPVADSVKYEERMGISGWVGNNHLFIGNRTLLEAHGIKAAPINVDREILKNNAFPVYIAENDQPTALLVIRYHAAPRIKYELQRACNTGLTVMINSSDPNIGKEMICDYFDVYDELIHVLRPKGVQICDTAASYEENCYGDASFNNDGAGLLAITTASYKLKSLLTLLTVVTVILQFAGIAAATVMILGGLGGITVGMILAYQLITALLSGLLSALYKL